MLKSDVSISFLFLAPILTLTSDRQSTSSIQLEDVLASLLGLPSNSHCSSGMHL
jgi:hypothetical protein